MSLPLPNARAAFFQADSPLAKMQNGDPAARLIARWRLPPFVAGLIAAVYGAVHALVLPLLFGHLSTSQGVTGALDDWPNLVIILLLVPLVIGYYAAQPAIIQSMYDGIAGRTGQKGGGAQRAAALLQPLGWPMWAAVAVAVGLLECVLQIANFRSLPAPTWQDANWLMAASLLPLRFATFYALVFMLVRQTAVLFGLNRYFLEFSVEIQPLHPDRAGGLRMLGDYVFTNGLVVAIVGLILGMGLLRVWSRVTIVTPELISELVIYFLAAPTVFFLLPLYSAHIRMAEAKQRLLAEIAEQFDLEYRVLLDGLRQDVLKLDDVERLEAIQKIYEITLASPEWPFNLGLVSKFGIAVVLPVLAPLGVDFLANLLIK